MPIVAMPDGKRVNFPDTMGKDEIRSIILRKYPNLSKDSNRLDPQIMKAAQESKQSDADFLKGLYQGGTFGFGDELLSAGLGAYEAATTDKSFGRAYDEYLSDARKLNKEREERSPIASLGGEVVGSIGIAIAATPLKFAEWLQKGNRLQKIAKTGATAAGSGALYGFGSGEGGFTPRTESGLTTGAISGLAGGALSSFTTLPATVNNLKNWAVDKFTKSRATQKAETKIASLLDEPEKALENLQQESVANLRASQKMDDPFLKAVEQKLANENPQLAREFEKMDTANKSMLLDEIRKVGGDVDVDVVKDIISDKRVQFANKVDDLLNTYTNNATNKLKNVDPVLRKQEASLVARDELEKALGEAKKVESEKWSNVIDEPINTNDLKDFYSDFVKTIPKAQRGDIPEVAKNLLKSKGGYKEAESVKEIYGLRKKLSEEARMARAEGKFNKARIADELSDSILEAIEFQAPQANEALREAIDFSRIVNQKFTQGEIGKILRPEKFGGDKVAPEITLDKLFTSGGGKAKVGLDKLLEASDTPNTRKAASEYILNKFNEKAVKNGEINLNQANKFIDDNLELLNKFPSLSNDLQSAINASQKLKSFEGKAKNINYSKSLVEKFINAPVEKEFDRLFSLPSQSLKPAIQQLKKQVRGDKSGNAQKALKTSFTDYLIRKSTSGDELVGDTFKSLLNSKQNKIVLNELFDKQELNRFNKLASEIAKIQSKPSQVVQDLVQSTATDNILETFTRVHLAQIGGRLGGGSVGGSFQLANIFSSKGRQFVRDYNQKHGINSLEELLQSEEKLAKLLGDMVQDRDLFNAINQATKGEKAQDVAVKKLHSWMVANGIVAPTLAGNQPLQVEVKPSSYTGETLEEFQQRINRQLNGI